MTELNFPSVPVKLNKDLSLFIVKVRKAKKVLLSFTLLFLLVSGCIKQLFNSNGEGGDHTKRTILSSFAQPFHREAHQKNILKMVQIQVICTLKLLSTIV